MEKAAVGASLPPTASGSEVRGLGAGMSWAEAPKRLCGIGSGRVISWGCKDLNWSSRDKLPGEIWPANPQSWAAMPKCQLYGGSSYRRAASWATPSGAGAAHENWAWRLPGTGSKGLTLKESFLEQSGRSFLLLEGSCSQPSPDRGALLCWFIYISMQKDPLCWNPPFPPPVFLDATCVPMSLKMVCHWSCLKPNSFAIWNMFSRCEARSIPYPISGKYQSCTDILIFQYEKLWGRERFHE